MLFVSLRSADLPAPEKPLINMPFSGPNPF